ncbi:unnamed protein product [Mytilus edulis]|uniref:Uncharacterized protein n=1 Tax=Mytilus edulis TaxID=6550 RepID=A0A8S3U490_MYTED|nr:unnamed protein product [Mytilus edulis]
MRRLCPKLNLDKTANIIPYTIIPIETYCDNPYLDEKTLNLDQNIIPYTIIPIDSYLDEKTLDVTIPTLMRRLCPKLNLDKTANIIPYTIIPIETYCDNPYLDEKTLSKAKLRQNSKYNTLHHHSYRDRRIVTILTLMRRLCPKLNLDKTANIIPYTIIPIETYCDNPYLDEKTLSKAELRQNSKYNTKHHHSYRDVQSDNPYLDEKTLSKAELRQNSKYNTLHHHSYRDVL